MALSALTDQAHPIIERMINNAVAFARKTSQSPGLRAAPVIRDRPPIPLLAALRSPAGTPQCVTLGLEDFEVTVDVNPNGEIDRLAEQRAWDCIRRVVTEHAA